MGVYPKGNLLEFRIFRGKFMEYVKKAKRITLFSSFKSIDYVEAALTKDLELVRTPIGPGPRHWYFGLTCELKIKKDSNPSVFECLPLEAYYRAAPPPSRAFFYILEASVYASRWFLGERYLEKALEFLAEGYRLGDPLDRVAVEKVLKYLFEKV